MYIVFIAVWNTFTILPQRDMASRFIQWRRRPVFAHRHSRGTAGCVQRHDHWLRESRWLSRWYAADDSWCGWIWRSHKQVGIKRRYIDLMFFLYFNLFTFQLERHAGQLQVFSVRERVRWAADQRSAEDSWRHSGNFLLPTKRLL